MVLNYKGKYYSDEDIAKRVLLAKTEIIDSNTRQFIMNLSKTKLKILKALNTDIQEICDCLFLGKHTAALTMTNLLFETMIKLTLAYYDAQGRTIDENGVEFENLLKDELNEYGEETLHNNITTLWKKGIITESGRDRLLDLKDLFRNPYSHGSNNNYVNKATTTIYKGQFGSDVIEECKVSVTGNPDLLLDARRTFVKQFGLSYFAELITYIEDLDKGLYELYKN